MTWKDLLHFTLYLIVFTAGAVLVQEATDGTLIALPATVLMLACFFTLVGVLRETK